MENVVEIKWLNRKKWDNIKASLFTINTVKSCIKREWPAVLSPQFYEVLLQLPRPKAMTKIFDLHPQFAFGYAVSRKINSPIEWICVEENLVCHFRFQFLNSDLFSMIISGILRSSLSKIEGCLEECVLRASRKKAHR